MKKKNRVTLTTALEQNEHPPPRRQHVTTQRFLPGAARARCLLDF